MNCSSFEPKLVPLVEGELTPRDRAAVLAHVEACTVCARLLEDVRIVDGLLLQARRIEPAENFTYRAMAEIRSMPPPRTRRLRWSLYVAAYLGVAWLAILAAAVFGGHLIGATFASAANASAAAAAGLDHLVHAGLRGFGHGLSSLTAMTIGVLVFDAALALAIALVYTVVRPRLAARLSRSEASR